MQWYYSKNGAQQGPVTVDELREKIAGGEVLGSDLGWREGMADWLPIAQIEELKGGDGGMQAPLAPAPGVQGQPYQGAPGTVAQPGMMPLGPPPIGSGKATASMVLGICGLVFSCIACIGLVLGILAVVFGSQVISEAQMRQELQPFVSRAKAGKIMGIIAIVLSAINGAAGAFLNISGDGF